MDIVYTLGSGSIWENNELRYSLRSVEKYCSNYDRVIVIGDNPNFLSDEVEFIPFQEHRDRAFNVLDKLNYLFINKKTSSDIFYMMDDIFFCKPVDCQNYPYYFKGFLPASERIRNHTQYNNSLENTRNWLLAKGKEIKHFGVHVPIIYNREKFLNIDWPDMYSFLNGFSIRGIYCNMLGITGQHRPDCKLFDIQNLADLQNSIQGIDCFSIADTAIKKGVEEYLQQEFPNKSRFER